MTNIDGDVLLGSRFPILREDLVPCKVLFDCLSSLNRPSRWGPAWGLIRYYWVIVKLVLTVIAISVLMLQTQTVDALAAAARAGDFAGMARARFSMMLHGSGGMIVLLIATVLSVYKPRGLTGDGAVALSAKSGS